MIIKNKKYIASFIVLSYLALSIANITHYHNITINTNLSENISEFPKIQKGFNHSFFECPISNTFNRLHNVTNLQIASLLVIFLQAQEVGPKSSQSYPSYLIYNSISLRAPPKLLS